MATDDQFLTKLDLRIYLHYLPAVLKTLLLVFSQLAFRAASIGNELQWAALLMGGYIGGSGSGTDET